MTEEERQRRLVEMEANAQAVEGERRERIQWAAQRDAREAQGDAAAGARGTFLREAHKEVYGAGSGAAGDAAMQAAAGAGMSIESSIRRRSHFLEKGRGDASAFRR
ncbi:hypothetical protein CLOM_g12990 [Closterium sp. NIES-68]|nr:hypothetical protein CLOM_g20840 [Closterium sp. NIES-68]GJP53866.1 hypothetical protein CLOM_g12990 [Closterium sp. NIES-68]